MKTFALAPQTKKYPTAVVDGLRGRRISRATGDVVACVRCCVEVPAIEWPWHGSLDTNRCVSPWEKQVARRGPNQILNRAAPERTKLAQRPPARVDGAGSPCKIPLAGIRSAPGKRQEGAFMSEANSRRCKFADCDRSPRSGARGYCAAHYAQVIRGRPLTAIRSRGGGNVRLGGVTVPLEVAAALKARGPTIYQAMREVLIEWHAGATRIA
jgi:hypothetical protein